MTEPTGSAKATTDAQADASVTTAVQDVALQLVDGTAQNADSANNADNAEEAKTNAPNSPDDAANKKKRLCRFPGCNRVIKSQGHCQRHGAVAKRCRIEGCDKQAQGTHDGMCKRHWKAVHFPAQEKTEPHPPPPPVGESVYDTILPQSIAFRPTGTNNVASTPMVGMPSKQTTVNNNKATTTVEAEIEGSDNNADPWDAPAPPEGVAVMPLVLFLRDNAHKKAGWHRNHERRARGVFPVSSLSCQLEPWERQLALVEILLLSGGTPYANFKDLSHAWGREKGFHNVLANSVCERRGEVERKRRSDAGKMMTAEERVAFREKLKKARTTPADKDVTDAAVEAAKEEVDSPTGTDVAVETSKEEVPLQVIRAPTEVVDAPTSLKVKEGEGISTAEV